MAQVGIKRLTLELDSGAEPIEGRMRLEGGANRDFVGWLGLAAALRSVVEDPTPHSGGVTERVPVDQPWKGR